MPNKKTLCIDARKLRHSGIGMYINMLLPYLCREFDVTLLGDYQELNEYADNATIIRFTAPLYSITEQLRFATVIPPADLFWAPHYNVPLTSIRPKKMVVTIHDVFHLSFFKELSLKQKVYAKLVINGAIKVSDAIITVSEFSKNEILRFTGANEDKISVIHNGVKQSAVINDSKSVFVKYKLPANYILYVGNVKPHKNLQALVHAYLLLPPQIQQRFKIVVVGKIDGFITGDGKLINMIDKEPLLKKSIVFTGFVNDVDMDAIYAAAALFILPSLYEGFGLPPLEAMLNGCPVLVSNQSSLPEVCGDAAIYFNPLDFGDIAYQIEKLLLDTGLQKTMVAKGLERVKLFSWEDSAVNHMDIFNNLISSKL